VDVSLVFSPFSPNACAAATLASGLMECGLYLNQPNRKSVSSVVLIACRILPLGCGCG